MNRNELKHVIEQAEKNGVAIREKTKVAVKDIANPHNSIVLTGCFQVGKSTLLNRVMLGSEILLSEGNGIPTTAIPTKIVYGERKELTVFFRDPAEVTKIYVENEITEKLLRSLTTAASEDDRVALASKIRYIQLALPVENIKNFTFFDTPGVDDPNQDLVELTTAEVLPNSDLVVLVVDASTALSQYSKHFLSKSIFQQGMSRVIVLASYNPKMYKSAQEREMILQTIRAELSLLGRGYIPVHSFTYNQDVDGNILRGADEIMSCLLDFIEKNKEQAKIDKALFYLGNDIVATMENLKAKLEVSGKSDEQLKELQKKISSAAISLDAEYVQTINDFSAKFGPITIAAGKELDAQLFESEKSVLAQFVSKFNDCENLEQTRNRVQSAVAEISPVVQNTMVSITASVENKTRQLLQESSDKISHAASRVAISGEFVPAISTGWAGKINPTILKIIEISGGYLFGNIFYAIGILIIDKIPVLKNILPHTFAKHIVLSSLKKSFTDSLESAKADVLRQLERTAENVKAGIKDAFGEIYEDRIAPYTLAMENNKGSVLSAEEVAHVHESIKKLESFNQQCAI